MCVVQCVPLVRTVPESMQQKRLAGLEDAFIAEGCLVQQVINMQQEVSVSLFTDTDQEF